MDEISVRKMLLSSETKIFHRPLADAGASPYTPINLSVLMPREQLTFNLYLKVAQQGRQDVAHVLFLKQGEAWERQWLDFLTQKGIDRLYFLNEDLVSVIAYLNNYLLLLRHQNAKVSRELLAVSSEQLNLSIRLAFQSTRFGPAVQKDFPDLSAQQGVASRPGASRKRRWFRLSSRFAPEPTAPLDPHHSAVGHLRQPHRHPTLPCGLQAFRGRKDHGGGAWPPGADL